MTNRTALPRTIEGQVAVTPELNAEIVTWWDSLSEQEAIIAALEAVEYHQFQDRPTYVAQKPWKWAAEAYTLRPQAECYVCGHMREQHDDPGDCSVDNCDCRDFEPFPAGSTRGRRWPTDG